MWGEFSSEPFVRGLRLVPRLAANETAPGESYLGSCMLQRAVLLSPAAPADRRHVTDRGKVGQAPGQGFDPPQVQFLRIVPKIRVHVVRDARAVLERRPVAQAIVLDALGVS